MAGVDQEGSDYPIRVISLSNRDCQAEARPTGILNKPKSLSPYPQRSF